MLWMRRHEPYSTSNTLVFTTYFYNALIEDQGHIRVSSWCTNQQLNIFEKKLVMFPFNDTHIGHYAA